MQTERDPLGFTNLNLNLEQICAHAKPQQIVCDISHDISHIFSSRTDALSKLAQYGLWKSVFGTDTNEMIIIRAGGDLESFHCGGFRVQGGLLSSEGSHSNNKQGNMSSR